MSSQKSIVFQLFLKICDFNIPLFNSNKKKSLKQSNISQRYSEKRENKLKTKIKPQKQINNLHFFIFIKIQCYYSCKINKKDNN